MAYASITKPSDYFNTKLYTGNGSTQSITGVGFQPDWVWGKNRDTATGHRAIDAVRGNTKVLYVNDGQIEETVSNMVTSFDSDGFSLGNDSGLNGNSNNIVSWNWKANGAGSANTDGSINSTVSVNTATGFSIVTYTGTGSNGTIGHGLGAIPEWVIVKKRSQADSWFSYHKPLGPQGRMHLDGNQAVANDTGYWNNTAPDANKFYVTSNGANNASGQTYVAYCFTPIKGYSKMGSYTGNGQADGPFIYTGFKPALIIVKCTDSTGNWVIEDNKRIGYNELNHHLYPNLSNAEGSNYFIDQLSNGFKIRGSSGDTNGTNGAYIYLSIAAEPLVANVGESIPTTAR